MKIALIGASGNVGRRILAEALSRGHLVTGIIRDARKLPATENLTPVSGNINDPAGLAPLLHGHDVIISSTRFLDSDPDKLIEAVRLSGVSRYLVVGGASSLEYKPGVLLLDSGHVPAFALEEARSGVKFLEVLRTVTDFDWTMLSPSALFTEGQRTGTFRLGKDTLLVGADGKSWISYEDFSIALLDEVEFPKHPKGRFTVGY